MNRQEITTIKRSIIIEQGSVKAIINIVGDMFSNVTFAMEKTPVRSFTISLAKDDSTIYNLRDVLSMVMIELDGI